MTRRAAVHDYTRPGLYHITLHVAEDLGQPFGAVVGHLSAPDGSADAPRTALSPVGQMVERELLHSIHAHYPMMEVQDYVIMPDHLHFIIEAHDPIVSRRGTTVPLGQVIAGFKKGCNRGYWALIGAEAEPSLQGKPAGTSQAAGAFDAPSSVGAIAAPSSVGAFGASSSLGAPSSVGAIAVSPQLYKVPSGASSGRQPLFSEGYCDVMPLHRGQLATQRAYIKGNPRSRLLRQRNRDSLTVQRFALTTALTPSALRGFLQRECPSRQASPDVLAAIEERLLMASDARYIACDTYGNRALLAEHRCLPVVCHRREAARYAEQKARCLGEAASGAVLVSACISPREREIITESVHHGFPVIVIHDNGFPDRYHPSSERLDHCADGRLLLVSPWQYQYRGKDEQVTVAFCKAMNCVAQALCRTKDSWWSQCP